MRELAQQLTTKAGSDTGINEATAIALGGEHMLILHKDGTVWSWVTTVPAA